MDLNYLFGIRGSSAVYKVFFLFFFLVFWVCLIECKIFSVAFGDNGEELW